MLETRVLTKNNIVVIRLNTAISVKFRLVRDLKSKDRLLQRTHCEISLQSKRSYVTPWKFYLLHSNIIQD